MVRAFRTLKVNRAHLPPWERWAYTLRPPGRRPRLSRDKSEMEHHHEYHPARGRPSRHGSA